MELDGERILSLQKQRFSAAFGLDGPVHADSGAGEGEEGREGERGRERGKGRGRGR